MVMAEEEICGDIDEITGSTCTLKVDHIQRHSEKVDGVEVLWGREGNQGFLSTGVPEKSHEAWMQFYGYTHNVWDEMEGR